MIKGRMISEFGAKLTTSLPFPVTTWKSKSFRARLVKNWQMRLNSKDCGENLYLLPLSLLVLCFSMLGEFHILGLGASLLLPHRTPIETPSHFSPDLKNRWAMGKFARKRAAAGKRKRKPLKRGGQKGAKKNPQKVAWTICLKILRQPLRGKQ